MAKKSGNLKPSSVKISPPAAGTGGGSAGSVTPPILDFSNRSVGQTFLGTSGHDTVVGSNLRDYLSGGTGNDSILGGGGNDSLYGDEGNDTLDGGSGNDLLDGGSGNDRIIDLVGDNTIRGGDGNDLITSGGGVDSIRGDAGNDTIDAGGGNDLLSGGDGNDSLLGGLGDDVLDGGSGNDTLLGGDGNDFIVDSGGSDLIVGGKGSDVITVSGSGNDTIFGDDVGDSIAGGNDIISAAEGNNSIIAGAGDDSISAGAGNDIVRGDAGRDTLLAGSGNDTLIGGADNDFLAFDTTDFDPARDSVAGGTGIDTLQFRGTAVLNVGVVKGFDSKGKLLDDTKAPLVVSGATKIAPFLARVSDVERIELGDGNDFFSLYTQAPTIGIGYLDGKDGNDFLVGTVNIGDTILGGSGNDTIRGYDNKVTGTGDLLDGGFDNDSIIGDEGNDTLTGGSGSDTLIGGSGSDTFVVTGEDSGFGDFIDTIRGDKLADTVIGGKSFFIDQGVDGPLTVDTIVLQEGARLDLLSGPQRVFDIESVSGSTSGDSIRFGRGGSVASVSAGGGDDTIDGGRDTVNGVSNQFLDGGSGDDSIVGGSGIDTILGGIGNDIIAFDENEFVAAESVDGGDGIDIIEMTSGGSFTDDLFAKKRNFEVIDLADTSFSDGNQLQLGALAAAATSNLTVFGGDGEDLIDAEGLGEALTVIAGAGEDAVYGSNQSDWLDGGEDSDLIAGGEGDDTIIGGEGSDSLFGDDGDDVFLFSDAVSGTLGDARLLSSDSVDGGAGFDVMTFNFPGDDSTPGYTLLDSDAANVSDVEGLVFGTGDDNAQIGDNLLDIVSDNLTELDGSYVPTRDGNDEGDAADFQGVEYVSLGDGDNTLIVNAGYASDYLIPNLIVDAGDDDDLIVFRSDDSDNLTYANLLVSVNGGDDTVAVESADRLSGIIDLGDGDNVLLVGAASGFDADIGDAIDSRFASAGNDFSDNFAGAVSIIVTAGNGDDGVLVRGSSVDGDLQVGAGNDSVTLVSDGDGGISGVVIDAGSGDNLVRLYAGLELDDSPDPGLIANSSGDISDVTVTASGGDDTVIAASVNDFHGSNQFDLGDGNNVISLFTTTQIDASQDFDYDGFNIDNLTNGVDFSGEDIAGVSIIAGEGDDLVLVASGYDIGDFGEGVLIDVGNGENTVGLYADAVEGGHVHYTTVVSGTGDDIVLVAGDDIHDSGFDLGAGDDVIGLYTSTYLGNIGGERFDGFDIDDVTIDGGAGDDRVTLVAGDDVDDLSIEGADGDDEITLYADVEVTDVGSNLYDSTVNSGAGDDVVTVAASGSIYNSTFDLGAGDDVLSVFTSTALGNIESLASGGEDAAFNSDDIHDLTIAGGDGDDHIRLVAGEDIFGTLDVSGPGEDGVFVFDVAPLSIDGGSGADTIELYSDLLGDNGDISFVDVAGGDDNDTIIAAATQSIAESTFTGGGGDDLIQLYAGSDLGSGLELFSGDGSSGVIGLVHVDAGDGSDSVSLVADSISLVSPFSTLVPDRDTFRQGLYDSAFTSALDDGLDPQEADVAATEIVDASADISFDAASTILTGGISTGDGDDLVEVYAGLSSDAKSDGSFDGGLFGLEVLTGNDNDTVAIAAGEDIAFVDVGLGGGDDVLIIATSTDLGDFGDYASFDGGNINAVTVDGGDGADQITLVSGLDIGTTFSFDGNDGPLGTGSILSLGVEVDGGGGDDTIKLYADLSDGAGGIISSVDVAAGEGDDTVVAAASFEIWDSTFDLGDGADHLTLITSTDRDTVEGFDFHGGNIEGVTVDGGDGDDVVTFVAGEDIHAYQVVSFGDGFDDSSPVSGDFTFDTLIDVGDGDNTVSLFAGLNGLGNIEDITVTAGEGDDTVTAIATGYILGSVFDLGGGDNVLRLATSTELDSIQGYEADDGVNERKYFDFDGQDIGNVTVTAGSGDDDLTLVAGYEIYDLDIDVGDGDNIVRLYQDLGNNDLSSTDDLQIADVTLVSGSGDDTILAVAAGDIEESTFDLGDGNNVLEFYTTSDLGGFAGFEYDGHVVGDETYRFDGDDIQDSTITAGDGSDTVLLVAGDDIDTVTIDVGDGDNDVKLYADFRGDGSPDTAPIDDSAGDVVDVDFVAGSGGDTVVAAASGNIADSTFDLGDGDNDLVLTTFTSEDPTNEGQDPIGGFTFDGGNIEDVTVIAGSGSDHIVLSSGEYINLVSIDAGSGDDLIELHGNLQINGEDSVFFVDGGLGIDTVVLDGYAGNFGDNAVTNDVLAHLSHVEQLILGDDSEGDISLVDLPSDVSGPLGEVFGTDHLRLVRSNSEDNLIFIETGGSIEDVTIDGAGGDDSFVFGGEDLSSESSLLTSEFDDLTVVGGSGEDVAFVYSTHEDAHLTFEGVEALVLLNSEDVTVDLFADGDYTDTVILRGSFAGNVDATFNFHDAANATVFGGNGDDVVNLLDGGRLVLLEGNSDDFDGGPFGGFSGRGASVESVFGSAASDLVVISDAGDSDTTLGSGLDYLELSGGTDTLYIAGNYFSVGGTLDGGGGQDTLILFGNGSEDDSVPGGINLEDAHVIGFETVQGSDLGDYIHIHSGATLVWGGMGNDYIEAGLGAQVIYGGNFDLVTGDGDADSSDFNFGNTAAGGSDVFHQGAEDGVAPVDATYADASRIQDGDSLTFGVVGGRAQVDLIYDFQVLNDSVGGGGNYDALDIGSIFSDLDVNDDGETDFDGLHDVVDGSGNILFHSLVRPESLLGPVGPSNLEDDSSYYALGRYDADTHKFTFDQTGDDLLFLRTDGIAANHNLATNHSIVVLVGFAGIVPSGGGLP